MTDEVKDGDQGIREAGDSKVKSSDTATKEASEGMDNQSKSVKDYYQARKGGLRDKDTREILGDQPQIVDGSKGSDTAKSGDSAKPGDSAKAADGDGDGKKSMMPEVPKDAVLNSAVARTDKSDIERDDKDRVTKVTDPDGKKTDIEYNKSGDPSKITKESTGETWEKSGNSWNQYDKDHKKVGQLDGQINVTKEGDIVASGKDASGKDNFWRQNHDGTATETKADKSIVTKDRDGNPTQIIYPDGKTSEVRYDNHGKPEEVKMNDATYKKDWTGKWEKQDKEGNKVKDMDGNFEVTKNGDIALVRDSDHTSLTKHTDGSTTRHRSDNSEVTTDIHDRVSKVKYPDGNSNEIEYDKKGDVSKIKGGNDDTWTRQGDHWTHKDKDGKEIDHLDGQMNVTKQGDIVAAGKDGTFLRQNTDGSFSETQKDKSIVSKDENGKVTDVIYPDGKRSEVKYDDSGNPSEVKLRDEGNYKKGDDGKWSKYDDSGNKVKDVDGDFQVNEKGDIALVRDSDKSSLTKHTDGSTERHRADGSEEVTDVNGRPTRVKYPSGHSNEFHYDKDGNCTSVKDEKGNTWKRSGDNWDRTDKDGKNIGHLDGGRVNVTRDGDMVITGKDGYFHRKNHDGSDTSLNDDKSLTTKDEKGRITEVQYPDGKKSTVGYDDSNKPVQIQTDDGSVWLKQGDKWAHYDRKSNEIGSWDGDMNVDKDGNLTVTDKKGTPVVVKKRDGSGLNTKDPKIPSGF